MLRANETTAAFTLEFGGGQPPMQWWPAADGGGDQPPMRGTLQLDSREHWAWPAYAFVGGPPADERVAAAVIGPTSVLRQEVR